MIGQTISGVYCDAKDCKYNVEGAKCCAPSITVIGESAHTTDETACKTFIEG
jgi:hypothetical protein